MSRCPARKVARLAQYLRSNQQSAKKLIPLSCQLSRTLSTVLPTKARFPIGSRSRPRFEPLHRPTQPKLLFQHHPEHSTQSNIIRSPVQDYRPQGRVSRWSRTRKVASLHGGQNKAKQSKGYTHMYISTHSGCNCKKHEKSTAFLVSVSEMDLKTRFYCFMYLSCRVCT